MTDTPQLKLEEQGELLTLHSACAALLISQATGRNWLKSGRLTPAAIRGGQPVFSKEAINSILSDLHSGKDNRLKSRRNKLQLSGLPSGKYKGYIDDAQTLQTVDAIVAAVREDKTLLPYTALILAEYALMLLQSANRIEAAPQEGSLLLSYCNGTCSLGRLAPLIDDLLTGFDAPQIKKASQAMRTALSHPVRYLQGQDSLGLLYLSLTCIGERKAAGAYYTPLVAVRAIVDDLAARGRLTPGQRIVDPCCGTGNFLVNAALHCGSAENLFGVDIDAMAVHIARLNLALHLDVPDIGALYRNITCADSLLELCGSYDVILGNPPWGYAFTEEQALLLFDRYEAASVKGNESFALFLENALQHCNPGGIVAFVLPQSLLTVGSHRVIRQILMRKAQLRRLCFLGNIFSGVQCPAIALTLERNDAAFSTKGMEVVTSTASFTIGGEREMTGDGFNFHISDAEYDVLRRIEHFQPAASLKGHADFALGIVTGDNKKYVLPISQLEGQPNAEPVLKGADLGRYTVNPAESCIVYVPEQFQQAAPEQYYRAPEKLLYRFISDHLVFAYDDKQTLSLNSCNVLIPHIAGLHIKYILAVLNSGVAQFYFRKKFYAVKILRTHLEQIPIPLCDAAVQAAIVGKVDRLLACTDDDERDSLSDALDADIAGLFLLDEGRRQVITKQHRT